ncbi:MAG: hypothetical protein ACJASQ_003563 [Crocinitomicaceae bacterium]|jgi:hypothetical protein
MSSNVTLVLNTINCVSTSESGKDEVYIKYCADFGDEKTYPSDGSYHSMSPSENNPWSIDHEFEFENYLYIQLMDSDTGSDDPLGSYTYQKSNATTKATNLVSNPNGAIYNLEVNQG